MRVKTRMDGQGGGPGVGQSTMTGDDGHQTVTLDGLAGAGFDDVGVANAAGVEVLFEGSGGGDAAVGEDAAAGGSVDGPAGFAGRRVAGVDVAAEGDEGAADAEAGENFPGLFSGVAFGDAPGVELHVGQAAVEALAVEAELAIVDLGAGGGEGGGVGKMALGAGLPPEMGDGADAEIESAAGFFGNMLRYSDDL